MALTNRDRVGKALELLQQGLRPYVQREMEAEYRLAWLKQAAYRLHKDDAWAENDPFRDAQALLVIMWDQWNSVFKETLGFSERAIVSELREVRNTWAHQASFTTGDLTARTRGMLDPAHHDPHQPAAGHRCPHRRGP